MILFTIKLINTIRKTIAGRRYPAQLAWGVAMGVLLGLIPHGNLLTVALVLLVLTLQVNHAVVALIGIALTFIAPKFDPQFDAAGRWIFEQPQVAETMAKAWQMPLVPWTDLNNTVVMGSFAIGLAALLPTFMLTYPVFRRWASILEATLALEAEGEATVGERSENEAKMDVRDAKQDHSKSDVRIDHGHSPLRRHQPITATSGRAYDFRRLDENEPVSPPAQSQYPAPTSPSRPTKVAINANPVNTPSSEPSVNDKTPQQPANSTPVSSTVPMKQVATPETNNSENGFEADKRSADDQQKIDEALSYLLRQLRDSKDKDAA